MSALPPEADMAVHWRVSPKGQKRTSQQIKSLFEHFVSACEQRRRHGDAECFRGLEVDHQFVLRRCLYRKIGRLLALEDTINVSRRAPKRVDWSGP